MHGARNCAGWDWKPEKYRRPGSVVYAFNIHQDNREVPRWRFLESSTYHNNHPYLREPGDIKLSSSSFCKPLILSFVFILLAHTVSIIIHGCLGMHFFKHRIYHQSIKLTDHVIGFLNNVYPLISLIIHWYSKYANNCWHCPSKGIISKLKTRNGILIFMDQWSESVLFFIYLFFFFFLEELLLILESFWK